MLCEQQALFACRVSKYTETWPILDEKTEGEICICELVTKFRSRMLCKHGRLNIGDGAYSEVNKNKVLPLTGWVEMDAVRDIVYDRCEQHHLEVRWPLALDGLEDAESTWGRSRSP